MKIPTLIKEIEAFQEDMKFIAVQLKDGTATQEQLTAASKQMERVRRQLDKLAKAK